MEQTRQGATVGARGRTAAWVLGVLLPGVWLLGAGVGLALGPARAWGQTGSDAASGRRPAETNQAPTATGEANTGPVNTGPVNTGPVNTTPANAQSCTELLNARDTKAVEACRAQAEEAEASPASQRMARIVGHDEYAIALLAFAHDPKTALSEFDKEIALLPESTVKPESLQYAVAYWHRATARQQLGQWDPAAQDLTTAEDSFTKAVSAAGGDVAKTEHLQDLRKRVVQQHAALLEQEGKKDEAQRLLRGP